MNQFLPTVPNAIRAQLFTFTIHNLQINVHGKRN